MKKNDKKGQVDNTEQVVKKESIFRQKSISSINSPEALNTYVRVASPGVWLTLVTILVFLAGVFVWGIYGHLETTQTTPLVVNDSTAMLCIEEYSLESIKTGMTVYVNDSTGVIGEITRSPVQAYTLFDAYRLHQLGLYEESWIFTAPVSGIRLKDGVYTASVLISTSSPFSLIFN